MTPPLDTAFLVFVLTSAAIYLCTSRRFLRVLFGFLLLSNAANLVLLASSGDPSGKRSGTVPEAAIDGAHVDPLPQALILTAIVIGFAVAAYLAVLLYRIYADRDEATLPALSEPVAPEGSAAALDEEAP